MQAPLLSICTIREKFVLTTPGMYVLKGPETTSYCIS